MILTGLHYYCLFVISFSPTESLEKKNLLLTNQRHGFSIVVCSVLFCSVHEVLRATDAI